MPDRWDVGLGSVVGFVVGAMANLLAMRGMFISRSECESHKKNCPSQLKDVDKALRESVKTMEQRQFEMNAQLHEILAILKGRMRETDKT